MKRPTLISLFLSLAFCAPVQATPRLLNVKGWHQPDWWKCDQAPGFVKVLYERKDYMDKSYCVRPSSLIRTGMGGRVMFQERDIWTRDSKVSPALAHLIKHPSVKGDKSGTLGWMEVNCQTMEYRYKEFMNVKTTSPSMHRSWKQFSWQPDASFRRGSHGGWTEWIPIIRLDPVQDWICRQVDI